jgi:hypothetical protein
MTTKLDTLDMTRHIRDSLYEQVKNMSPAERLAFYHAQAQIVHRQLGLPLLSRSADTTDVMCETLVQDREE